MSERDRGEHQGWGPGFLPFAAWPYRLEMALGFIGLVIVLFYWRLLVVGGLDLTRTLLWILWPDLVDFIPIGVTTRGRGSWPSWGPALYNIPHTFAVWVLVFVLWSALQGRIEWPLLGWAGHIAPDRALAFYLRVGPSAMAGEAAPNSRR